MRTCVCNECGRARAHARRHVHEGASTRACERRQLVRVRAHAPADAGADRINGRALLAAAGWTVGRTGRQLTLSRAGDNNLSIPL